MEIPIEKLLKRELRKLNPQRESTSIRRGVKTINDDTRFVLVKYFKIFVEILEYLIKEDMINEEQVSKSLLDIDTMLERVQLTIVNKSYECRIKPYYGELD